MESTLRLCNICTKPGPRICANCHNSRYCSRECQQVDWPTHKLVCKTFKDFQKRPEERSRRAIYFPDSGGRAQFTWLPFTHVDDECEGHYHVPDLSIPFRKDKRAYAMMNITFNPARNRPLSHTIALRFRDTFLIDGSKPNGSIAALIDTT